MRHAKKTATPPHRLTRQQVERALAELLQDGLIRVVGLNAKGEVLYEAPNSGTPVPVYVAEPIHLGGQHGQA
jgi:hypothetical protein